MHPALNFLVVQIGWFACVLGGARHQPWLGPSIVLVLVAVHLALAKDRAREFEAVLTAGAVGVLAETGLHWAGLVTYPGAVSLPPLWIVALWVQFGTTLRSSLGWLAGRPVLAILVGGLGGPLAFRGGESLGAVQFAPNRGVSFLGLATVWAIALPCLIAWAHRPLGAKSPPLSPPSAA